jgi:hypothetical protein
VTNADGSHVTVSLDKDYEVHVTKTDGSHVTVILDKNYAVLTVGTRFGGSDHAH